MACEFIYNLKPINNYTDNSESNLWQIGKYIMIFNIMTVKLIMMISIKIKIIITIIIKTITTMKQWPKTSKLLVN